MLDNGKGPIRNFDDLGCNIGFCPQNDIFLEDISVHDNLKYMAKVKNIEEATIEKEIDRIL